MANLQETLKTYNAKRERYEKKTAEKRQEIATLIADIAALPSELQGQSEEFINRQKKILERRIALKTKNLEKYIETQKQKIEDWLAARKRKIQEGVDKIVELEKQTIEAAVTLQAQITAAILTGVKPEAQEDTTEEEEEKLNIPPTPVQRPDSEYQYSYINDLGKEIYCTGAQAAKRKAYSPIKVYTDEDYVINKYKIKRRKR